MNNSTSNANIFIKVNKIDGHFGPYAKSFRTLCLVDSDLTLSHFGPYVWSLRNF
jgi:hypothetical protein